MREWIVRAVKNRDAVNIILAGIDVEKLSSGQVLVTPSMLGAILKIICDGKFEVSNVSVQGGGVSLDIKTKSGISLRYNFRLVTAVISRGQLILKAKYTEEKLSSGIGSAFLNLSGKSGLALALGKTKGIFIDGTNVEINIRGIPEFVAVSYLRSAPGGLVFSVE